MFKPKPIVASPHAMAHQRAWADFCELWLAPVLMALCPEHFLVSVWRVLLRHSRLYQAEAAAALYGRQSVGKLDDIESWTLGFRLQRALDYGDAYRSWRWHKRRRSNGKGEAGRVTANVPATLIFGLHWGQGMRALHEQNQLGHQVSFLSGKLNRADYGRHFWRYWYARFRVWVTARVGGQAVIMTGGAYAQMRQCLDAGQSVWALYDLPAYLQGLSQSVVIEQKSYAIPEGLLRLALERPIAMQVCTSAYELDKGGYQLNMTAIAPANRHELADLLAHTWHAVMQTDERQWHNWQHERAPAE
ncbi:MAG: hypothetical protein RLZZ502_1057 [Pseudomonadota bacterium]|jgi:hypothetical protein